MAGGGRGRWALAGALQEALGVGFLKGVGRWTVGPSSVGGGVTRPFSVGPLEGGGSVGRWALGKRYGGRCAFGERCGGPQASPDTAALACSALRWPASSGGSRDLERWALDGALAVSSKRCRALAVVGVGEREEGSVLEGCARAGRCCRGSCRRGGAVIQQFARISHGNSPD